MLNDNGNVENNFSQLAILETKLLKTITCGIRNTKIFEDFSNLLPDVYPKDVVMRNYLKIAQLIWKNQWDLGTWNDEDIYSKDFKDICRTPIYLPSLGKELLSGEYIMFLILGKNLKLECYIPLSHTLESYTEAEYKKEYARNADKRKHERFYGSKNSKSKPYLDQFSEYLTITWANDSSVVETVTGRLKRKGTDTYRMFDEYAYAAYDINKDAGESIDILGIFDTPYVYNIDCCEILDDIFLPVRCEGLLLFKTVLFQHLDRCQRGHMMAFASRIQELVKLIPNVISNWRRYISLLSGRRKQSTFIIATEYKKQIEASINWIENEIDSLRIELESKHPIINETPHSEYYSSVMWRFLVLEAYAASKISRTSINANVETTKETEKLHSFISLEPLNFGDIKKMEKMTRWEDFFRTYGNCLMEYFDEHDEDKLKKDWLLALKTILYCNYDSVKRCGAFIPKKLDDTWLQQHNIPIQSFPIGGIFTVMQFVRNSSKQKVRLKEMSVRMINGNLSKRKIFLELLPDSSNENTADMRQVLESLTYEKFTPVFAMQIRELLREYKAAVRANQDILKTSRTILSSLWDIFDQFVKNISIFEESERNMIAILKRLNTLNNQIAIRLMEIDFPSHFPSNP